MTTKAFDRWVFLPPDCNFVPVKKIERLLCAACEASMAGRSAEDAEAMGFDFGGRVDQDYILRMVLERRNAGSLRVFGAGGFGVIRDDNVLSGVLRRDDFEQLMADEWHTGVRDAPLDQTGKESATTESPTAKAASRADAAMLARCVTRDQLIAAFPQFLNADKFRKLEGWLLKARQRKGTPGRNGRPALFCPYAIMLGITTKIRGKGKLPQARGWHILLKEFPDTYAAFEAQRPRTGTADDD